MENVDIYNTPSAPAPPGYAVGIADHPTQQPGLVAAGAICLSLAAIFVSIRIFTKAVVLRNVKSEDYALVVSLLGLSAFIAVIIVSGENGQGRHQWNVSIAGAMAIAKYANISEILYPIAMFAAKYSVLKQTERIFCGTRRDMVYWTTQAMIWLNGLFDFGIIIAFLCACVPREKIWNPTVPGVCIGTNNSIIATSVLNLISDWSALILPLVVIQRLRMDTQRKLGVAAIFAVGLLACIASIVRLVYTVILANSTDETWAIDPVAIWAFVEFATVILSGCFPVLPKFIQFCRYGHSGPPMRSKMSNSYNISDTPASRRTRSVPMDTMASHNLEYGDNMSRKYHELDENRSTDKINP